MLERFRVKKHEIYNIASYGTIKGKFNINYDIIPQLLTDKYICQNYALVEKKTEYYRLIFDFDYKPLIRKSKNNSGNLDFFKCYNKKEDELTDIIIKYINIVLNEIFIESNTKYIYCDKNIGFGVHLYYPHIIVNKIVHSNIMEKVINKLLTETTYNFNKNVWENIVDGCVSDANSLRIPYTYILERCGF
jgi:hypothetical protein